MPVRAPSLIGRAAELVLIADALDDAPRFILVTGEPGIGKTRLLEAATSLARERGIRVLTAACAQGCEGMPFLPLLQPLAEATGRRVPAVATVLLPDAGASMPADQAARASRRAAAIHAALADQPTLLVVDDVHWADPSTLATLDFVARRTRSEQLMVLVAARDDPRSLARIPFADGRSFKRLELGRLTRDQVAAQVAALAHETPGPGDLDRLFRRSAGNPLFVTQLLTDDVSGRLPATLAVLLERRLAGLEEPSRRALAALAVLGGPTDEELVSTVAGLDPVVTEAGLRDATAAGVVCWAGSDVEFRHPLFREVVTATTGPAAARLLHAAAARSLEAAGADATVLARHWLEAGDRSQAFRWSLAASEASAGALAFPEARNHLCAALDLWLPDQAPLPRWQATAQAARFTWLCGDAPDALALVRRAIAERPGETQELALDHAEYAWDADDVPTATAAFARAASLVDNNTSPERRAAAHFGLARALVPPRRYADACAAARQGLVHAAEAADTIAERRLRGVLGVSLVNDGDIAAGLDELRRGTTCTYEPDNLVAFVAAALALSGQLEAALDVALEGIEAVERQGLDDTYGADLRGRAALCLVELGRWTEADEVLGPAARRGLPDLARGLLALRRGAVEPATRALRDVSPAGAPAAAWPGALAAAWALARAELALLRGDPASARQELEQIEIGHPETPWDLTVVMERRAIASRCVTSEPGASDDAAGDPLDLPDRVLACGLAAEADGDWARARAAWTSPPRPYRYASVCLEQASTLFGCGDRRPAREALHEAARVAAELGAGALSERIHDLARRARVQALPRARAEAGPFEPTPRELVVLGLLAEGLTNRDIAARLFLSPKTVGIHVSRLLRKLGAHTRGEAVANARRRGMFD